FGPVVKYQSFEVEDKVVNFPPSKGLQFFGTVKIDGGTEVMTVTLRNIEGKVVYEVDLSPEENG
ncbi:MAG: alkaline phosphatase, partial [Okeania sp. SIO2D1]|nr:alkaline phosphatase [Okeania sp. SIO2D1]